MMKRRVGNQLIFFVLLVLLLSTGCCSFFREDFTLLDPEDFPAKVKQLEEISQNHKSMSVRIRAHFYVALACLHYNNPSPDYVKALEYLEEYIVLDSDNKDIDEIVAWKSTLLTLSSSLQEYEKLERSYAQLKQEYERANESKKSLNKQINDLTQMIERQKKEIGNLEETIRKLDAVQQEIEKKKKKVIKKDLY